MRQVQVPFLGQSERCVGLVERGKSRKVAVNCKSSDVVTNVNAQYEGEQQVTQAEMRKEKQYVQGHSSVNLRGCKEDESKAHSNL